MFTKVLPFSPIPRAALFLLKVMVVSAGFFAAAIAVQAAGGPATYRIFPGGSLEVAYAPHDSQCSSGTNGKVTISGTVVPSSYIKKWNKCRGFIWLDVPTSLKHGPVVVAMDDGKKYDVGELFTLDVPVITEVSRQVLGTDKKVTRIIVRGSGFPVQANMSNYTGSFAGIDQEDLPKVFGQVLYVGNREINDATWEVDKVAFVLDGVHPDTDLVSLRSVTQNGAYSPFAVERKPSERTVPSLFLSSAHEIEAGAQFSVFGYGLKQEDVAGTSPYDLKVHIGDQQLPADAIVSWSDTAIVMKPSQTFSAWGAVRVTLVRKSTGVAVSASGPSMRVLPPLTNDEYSVYQQYLRQAYVDGAWKYGHGSSDVVVAVVDSGIDVNHPDLRGNIWTNADEIPGNSIDDDKNGYVDDVHGYDFVSGTANLVPYSEHGTAVAGIIGATGDNGTGVAGINWNVQLMPVLVIGHQGSTAESVGKAIRYAVDNGADIINLSLDGYAWAGKYAESLSATMQYAQDKGVLVVASAGNSDSDENRGIKLEANPLSPVCNDGYANMVVGVGSVDAVGGKSRFSNYGKCVDLMAPGENMVTLGALSPIAKRPGLESGTSLSAAVVSGIAALVKAANPELRGTEIRDVLMSTAHSLGGPQEYYGSRFGAGLVDAEAALLKVAGPLVAPKPAPASPSVTPAPSEDRPEVTDAAASSVDNSLRGRILLQVQAHGEAWFVHPATGRRHYMKDGSVAYQMMRNFGLGITDADLANIPVVADTAEMKSSSSACAANSTVKHVKGQILLQVQAHGEAWYVDPVKCRRIYMKDGAAAYGIMRYLGLGITDADLSKITVGE